ncbi:D-tyrosyl-tRNA(Tyr) deacylase [Candidatus Sumerlaeota bacterium]|nr:D-tyrosyl-tRNA(Tyr) deacylase [Candidatus Sumerlaeota bacterium]
MRFLIQRVSHAEVAVDGAVVGRIQRGLLVFVGLGAADNEALFTPAIEKITNLRIFRDAEGKMNLSLRDVGGEILAISQFTLYADARKGRRPSYTDAMPPAQAEEMFERFVAALRAQFSGVVQTGRFGADMKITLLNDGPVTIWLDSAQMNWA